MGATIYRGYDRAALDAQVNLRARWPEHPEYFARWQRDSQAARAALAGRLDLAYGPSAGQTLDLFPAGRNAPLLVFIHGGYWRSLDKGDFSYLAPAFVDAGIACAVLNYDLAPAVTVATIVAQVRGALAWLYREAVNLGFDGARITVSGHSAGGHLTAIALTTPWAQMGGLPQDMVKAGCSVSGLYDLEPIRLSFLQDDLALDPATVAQASPLRLIPAGAGPLLCAVGDQETEEFLLQQAEYLSAWQGAGLAGAAVPLPGRNHFTAVDALGEAGHPLCEAAKTLVLEGRLPAESPLGSP